MYEYRIHIRKDCRESTTSLTGDNVYNIRDQLSKQGYSMEEIRCIQFLGRVNR